MDENFAGEGGQSSHWRSQREGSRRIFSIYPHFIYNEALPELWLQEYWRGNLLLALGNAVNIKSCARNWRQTHFWAFLLIEQLQGKVRQAFQISNSGQRALHVLPVWSLADGTALCWPPYWAQAHLTRLRSGSAVPLGPLILVLDFLANPNLIYFHVNI